MRILLDANVFLDSVLPNRPCPDEARQIIKQSKDNKNQMFIYAKSILDIHYQIQKKYKDRNARQLLKNLLTNFIIIDTIGRDCLFALDSPIRDYEDAVLLEGAVRNDIDCIITSNIKDYKNLPIPAITPHTFLTTPPKKK